MLAVAKGEQHPAPPCALDALARSVPKASNQGAKPPPAILACATRLSPLLKSEALPAKPPHSHQATQTSGQVYPALPELKGSSAPPGLSKG
eukprot:scaffold1340_cov253-Pinguiococcus_pyrenoidosus.AAC.4